MTTMIVWAGLGLLASAFFLMGCRIIEPTERGLIERLGNYHKFAEGGFYWIIPFIDKMRVVNVTEMMVNAQPQEIITKDKLNAIVDAQVYFKVNSDEKSVKNSQYNVFDYELQIVNLARTTLRNIIGTMSLNDANSDRNKINNDLSETLMVEAKNWGIDIIRTELKEINPPQDVQATMNKVVKAENEKQASIDMATALETQADGAMRASIKQAEGIKRAKILEAEGEAQYIQLVNESAEKYFIGNAQLLKKLEVTEKAMANGTKYIIDSKSNIMNVIGDIAGVPSIQQG